MKKKSRGESRDKKYKPKHNKGNIKEANTQQRIKLMETKSISTKVRDKTAYSLLIYLTYSVKFQLEQ